MTVTDGRAKGAAAASRSAQAADSTTRQQKTVKNRGAHKSYLSFTNKPARANKLTLGKAITATPEQSDARSHPTRNNFLLGRPQGTRDPVNSIKEKYCLKSNLQTFRQVAPPIPGCHNGMLSKEISVKKLVLVLSALSLVACAPSPDSITPVSMTGAYNGASCDSAKQQLDAERKNLTALETSQRNARTTDTITVAFTLIPLGSVFGGNKKGLIAESKGKVNALEERMQTCRS